MNASEKAKAMWLAAQMAALALTEVEVARQITLHPDFDVLRELETETGGTIERIGGVHDADKRRPWQTAMLSVDVGAVKVCFLACEPVAREAEVVAIHG